MAQVAPEDALEAAQAQESDGHGHSRRSKNSTTGLANSPAKAGWDHRLETYRKFFRLLVIGAAWIGVSFSVLHRRVRSWSEHGLLTLRYDQYRAFLIKYSQHQPLSLRNEM